MKLSSLPVILTIALAMLLLPAGVSARTDRSAKPVPKKYAMYYDSKACSAVASRS